MSSLGVLILNYYSYEETLRYVADLKQQTTVTLSILIVDNASPNGAFQKLDMAFRGDPLVTVLQSPRNGGYAYGNNFGLRHLFTRDLEYILVSNNDLKLDSPDLLYQLLNVYEQLDSPGLIAPKMLVNGKEDHKHQAWRIPKPRDSRILSLRTTYRLFRWMGRTNTYHFGSEDTGVRPVDCLSGSLFLASKEVMEALYPWDENTFLYGEESILGKEVEKIGRVNYLVRSLSYHHHVGTTTTRLHSAARLRYYWLQSTLYFHRKYDNLGPVGASVLYLLFLLWIPETLIIQAIRRFSGMIRKPALPGYKK